MFGMMFLFFLIFLVSTILLMISIIISKKSFFWREKFSSFECGFDSYSKSRFTFSMNFFLIAIIFIIFDVEIAMILPIIPMMVKSSILVWMTSSYLIFFILILGTFLEWKEMSFDWKN